MTDVAYKQLAAAFTASNPESYRLYQDACESLPGGNVRTVLYYDPFPLAISRAESSKLVDVDGHEYCDLLGEYTAGLYGHSDPQIADAITAALQRGLSFGGQHADEARLASLIEERMPQIDLLRFTNSGTEGNLMAIALAKVYTGKKKVVVFSGGYHGGVLGWKGCDGSPLNVPHEFLIARYNDVASVQAIMTDDVAAILVEPMIGSGGGIVGKEDFLLGIRRLATRHGALLIFDEVMSSRMYNGGGIGSIIPVDEMPDLTTLGKWIGGGMSFGAFGGRKEIMALFDPRQHGALAHAGTFNNNVLTMAAGCVGLEKIFTTQRARALHARGEQLQKDLNETCNGTILRWTGLGSLLCSHFLPPSTGEITCPDDLAMADFTLAGIFHLWLLQHGFYIGRRGFIALSLAVTDSQLESFAQAVAGFVSEYSSLLTTGKEPSCIAS